MVYHCTIRPPDVVAWPDFRTKSFEDYVPSLSLIVFSCEELPSMLSPCGRPDDVRCVGSSDRYDWFAGWVDVFIVINDVTSEVAFG